MIVADRKIMGYNAEIELHMDFSPESYSVKVFDPCGVFELEARDREQAKDMFFHPFAYGYTEPTINLSDDD